MEDGQTADVKLEKNITTEQHQNGQDNDQEDDEVEIIEGRSFIKSGICRSKPYFKGITFVCFGVWKETWTIEECEQQIKNHGGEVIRLVDMEDCPIDAVIIGRGTSLKDIWNSQTMSTLFAQVRVAFLNKVNPLLCHTWGMCFDRIKHLYMIAGCSTLSKKRRCYLMMNTL